MSLNHLSDERLQEWLDGRLSQREKAAVEAHLASCARCRAEADAWSTLMADLSSLPTLAPRTPLGERVLVRVEPKPARLPLAARVRAWLGGLLAPPAQSPHPTVEILQDLAAGVLARGVAARVRAHTDGCPACRREAEGWGAVVRTIDALPRLSPSAGFADAVMARVLAERAAAPVPARVVLARGAADGVRRVVGTGRRRPWAAAAGVALTPATVLGLAAYAVFSHPLVTVDNLTSFATLKGGALAGGVAGGLAENATLFSAWTAVDTLTRTVGGAGTALLGFSVLTVTAAWVLYRNVFASPARPAGARARS